MMRAFSRRLNFELRYFVFAMDLWCGWVSKCVSAQGLRCCEIAGRPLCYFSFPCVCVLVTRSLRVWDVDLVVVGSLDLLLVMMIGGLGLISCVG